MSVKVTVRVTVAVTWCLSQALRFVLLLSEICSASCYCKLEEVYFDVTNCLAGQKDLDCLKSVIIIKRYREQVASMVCWRCFGVHCTCMDVALLLTFIREISCSQVR